MTIGTVIGAFGALARLAASPLPVRQAYRLNRLLCALEGDFRYYEAKRAQVLADYPEPRTPEEEERAGQALEAILCVESEAQFTPVTLSSGDCAELRLSSNDVAALNGLVHFVLDEEHDAAVEEGSDSHVCD